MAADFALAVLHHLLVFSLVAIVAIQIVLVKPGLRGDGIARLARFDMVYGGLAAAILAAGFVRAYLSLKGWGYYSGYWVFWAKIGAFTLVGLLSIVPTIGFRRWLNAAKQDSSYSVPNAEIARMRPWLQGEGVALVAILVLAAAMARGIGY